MAEPCSRKRGARPSRSLCSASRRTEGVADSTYRMVRQGDCCKHVGGTPTAAVETAALPICNCIVPYSKSPLQRFQSPGDFLGVGAAVERRDAEVTFTLRSETAAGCDHHVGF